MHTDSTRYEFLDWLRVIAIFILLFFHTGMLFVGWGWHIVNAESIPALVWPMDISHRLRMPLLFVIAGAGLWYAMRSRSGAQTLRERSLRLLLPLVAGMFLIVPPQVFLERVFQGQWSGGYLQFLFERVLRLQPYPQGDFSWHHLWFIAYLYIYVVVSLPLLVWWRRRQPALKPGLWLYTLALPLALNEVLLKPLFPETHALVSDWYVFNHYLLLTLYGFLLASMPGAWDWLAAQRRRALGWGVAFLVAVVALLQTGAIRHGGPIDSTLASVFTWLCLMAFFGYGRRHLSFSNGLLRWARDASYPIYILHQTVIIMLGYVVVQQPWSPWTKYAVVLSGTVLSCVLLYEQLVRRFAFTRLIFGMKPAPSEAPMRVSPPASAA